MALINCPECGKWISDKAKTCPECGYPIAQEPQQPQQPIVQTGYKDDTASNMGKKVKKKHGIMWKIGIAFVVLIVIGEIFGDSSKNNTDGKKQIDNSASFNEPMQKQEQEDNSGIWATSFSNINDFDYTLNKNAGTITLVRYYGDEKKIMLSPVYNIGGVDYNLISTGDDACFLGEISLTSVYLPYGVTHISANCFNSCSDLQYIYIPASVVSLDASFFDYIDPYSVTFESDVALPDERDSGFYEEKQNKSEAEETGAVVGGAVNGIMAGLFEGLSEEDDVTTEIFFGGTKDQWNAMILKK